MTMSELNRAIRTWLWGKPEQAASPELRELSHQMNNDVMMLQHNLRRIADAPDPVVELVKTMRGQNDRG